MISPLVSLLCLSFTYGTSMAHHPFSRKILDPLHQDLLCPSEEMARQLFLSLEAS
jgi:hypothetical protein